MLFTLAFVVLIAAIVVLFSQEFIGIFKKAFQYKWVQLILPLALGSWVYYYLHDWCIWSFSYVQEGLRFIAAFIVSLIPLKVASIPIALIFICTVFSVFPVYLLNLYLFKKTYRSYAYPYFTSSLIWLICVFLLLSLYSLPT